MDQSKVIPRIEEICKEFDYRVGIVGLTIARLELAKALAEAEAAQHTAPADLCPECGKKLELRCVNVDCNNYHG